MIPHRQVYVFQASADDSLAGDSFAGLQNSLPTLQAHQGKWIGDDPKLDLPVLAANKAKTLLGQSLDWIIYDARCRFNADVFGIVSGVLRGGGCFYLLLPPSSETQSPFMQRLYRLLIADSTIQCVSASAALPIAIYPKPRYATTADQQQAIKTIVLHAHAKKTYPLVMTADRGRGKSAALGMAAKQLFASNALSILLTGPSKATVNTLLSHAGFPERLRFIAPDALLNQRPDSSLLWVDEAAAIPLPILQKLLQRYPRVVFSTTLHGYEGSGRGFAIRFKRLLDQHTPTWQSVQLEQPIRWANDDPLEAFVNQALLLKPPLPSLLETDLSRYTFTSLSRLDLLADEALLGQLFGLLVSAHYQTKPSDLHYLLDSPDVSVYALHDRHQLIAVLMSETEGGFSAALAADIYAGKRRPKGHMLAQSLAFHAGAEDAAILRCERVIRIAVHPDYQGQGLGSRLLQAWREKFKSQVDYIGTSFACTAEVLAFWLKNNFLPARLGLKQDASTGVHSLMMVQACSDAGLAMQQQIAATFNDHLLHLLPDSFKNIDAELLIQWQSNLQKNDVIVSHQDRQVLQTFAKAHRGYEVSFPAIYRFVSQSYLSQHFQALNSHQQALLIKRVLQRQHEETVCEVLSLSGKKQLLSSLREAVGQLLNLLGDVKT